MSAYPAGGVRLTQGGDMGRRRDRQRRRSGGRWVLAQTADARATGLNFDAMQAVHAVGGTLHVGRGAPHAETGTVHARGQGSRGSNCVKRFEGSGSVSSTWAFVTRCRLWRPFAARLPPADCVKRRFVREASPIQRQACRIQRVACAVLREAQPRPSPSHMLLAVPAHAHRSSPCFQHFPALPAILGHASSSRARLPQLFWPRKREELL